MIEYAEEREAEEAARPLYIAHYMLSKMNGAEPMGYDVYISQIMSKETGAVKEPRTPSQIEADFDAIVAADKERRRKLG